MGKTRVDSVNGQLELHEALANKIMPPDGVDLTDLEVIVFDEFIEALPIDQWDSQSIRMAARLAKMEVYFDHLVSRLESEGSVITNDRGTPISNPMHSAVTTTWSTVKMMRSTLGITASQRTPERGKLKARHEAEKAIKSTKPKPGERPSLLAV